MEAIETRFARLADGRRLGYVELGDPGGWPVVNCHGALAGRLDVVSAGDEARSLGIRLVSPDRPGVGFSDPRPERTTGDWAADVAALLDTLGIDRFSVLGWSMGGLYALACAALLGARVERVAVVAGAIPPDEPGARARVDRTDRSLTSLARHVSPLGLGVFAASGRLARWTPRLTTRVAALVLAPPDRAAIERMGPDAYARMVADAQRQPSGMVEEYRAWTRPWGFRPEDVEARVDLWYGTEDRLVPTSWPERLAERLARAEVHVVAGAGHFVGYDRWREILPPLDPRPRADATAGRPG